ncbi:serine protease inhibitor 77Ba-like [Galleria mellonella]|uniref:Serine protease inhibitor 77Ba-like n=1 Tax=Galleria mellonella TaxID=7137 RepID=A0A6J1W790_GALME|nr:serine protease inhibitor 77Ba-like [Galleria mellonella]
MCNSVVKLLFCVFLIVLCSGQSNVPPVPLNTPPPPNLHIGLTERIGNFSVELLYHTSKIQNHTQNLIVSPITVWSVLAVISEGASHTTLAQIHKAIRLSLKNRESTRNQFRNIAQYLLVNTKTVELAKINAIFVNIDNLPLIDFRALAKNYYDTDLVPLNFTDSQNAANSINRAISNVTHGRIKDLVDSSIFRNAPMVLTSGLYFRGQWTLPFNASSTMRMPFFNSKSEKIGEVNMMYNRNTYPFANIQELKARVIEIPYGVENRLSMLIMLPHPGVSVEDMFFNFYRVTLDRIFEELKIAKEEYGDDEVDCFIPRFKIESNLDLTEILKNQFNIVDLFDENRARLPFMARTPLYVSKIIHKAEIEVTEEGTTASGVTLAEFSNRIGTIRFEANRPFTYVIVEKTTNTIVFGGFYQQPSLY